jgi:hypothetical protein
MRAAECPGDPAAMPPDSLVESGTASASVGQPEHAAGERLRFAQRRAKDEQNSTKQ